MPAEIQHLILLNLINVVDYQIVITFTLNWLKGMFYIKEIVHPKMKISNKSTHTQAIQDDDEFVSSLEHIWRNVSLHHSFTSGSSAVNGCRENESPNSW